MGIFNKKHPLDHFYVLFYLIDDDIKYLKRLTIEIEYSEIKSDDEIIKIVKRIIKKHVFVTGAEKTELLVIDRVYQINLTYHRQSHDFVFMHPDLLHPDF